MVSDGVRKLQERIKQFGLGILRLDEKMPASKAAGVVAIQLWNLNKPSEQALLGQWQVQPQELHDLWFRSLVTGYRLTFDAPGGAEVLAVPTTVKVAFTDYLTGRTLSAQHVIEPGADQGASGLGRSRRETTESLGSPGTSLGM